MNFTFNYFLHRASNVASRNCAEILRAHYVTDLHVDLK